MRRFSRDARGFSLVEALIAIAVAALLIGALVDLFLATQRDAAVTEDRLTDVLAAQSVGELLRSKLASNPAFLRDFAPGPDGKVHLTGSDLHCTALGQETVDVTLENDNELEPQQPVPELTALVQRATITVTHAQRFGEAPVRLTVRLVVPPDSLPAAALAKLYETHAAVFDVRTEQTAFRQQLAAWQVDLPPGYATPPDDDMNLLADANQLVAQANAVEWITVDKAVPGSVQLPDGDFAGGPVPAGIGMEEVRAGLEGQASVVAHRLAITAGFGEAGWLLAGAHKVAPLARDLDGRSSGFMTQNDATLTRLLDRVRTAYAQLLTVRQLAAGQGADANARFRDAQNQLAATLGAFRAELAADRSELDVFFTAVSLWKTVNGSAPYLAVLEAISTWPDRFRRALDTAFDDANAMAHADAATPHERASALRQMVTALQLRELAAGAALPAKQTALRDAAQLEGVVDEDLLRYLTTGDVFDVPALLARNAAWRGAEATDLAALEPAAGGETVVQRVIRVVQGGKVGELAEKWSELALPLPPPPVL